LGDIAFGGDGRATFPTKYHGEVTLSKEKWDRICGQPERWYYRHNGDKVATTLVAPDNIRSSQYEKNQFFYYKGFERFSISERVDGPLSCKYMAVIIDVSTKRICTVYPVEKPKPGQEFKPVEGKT
jgi:hypothetical protein